MSCGNKVAVTGIGCVSPYENGVNGFWREMGKGSDAIADIQNMNLDGLYVQKGGEVKWYRPQDFFSNRELSIWDKNTQFALLAMEEACNMAAMKQFPQKTGIFMGTLTAGLPFAEVYYRDSLKDIYRPRYITQCFRAAVTNNIACKYNITGPRITVTTACSASMHAIGIGAEYVKKGLLDVAVVGGVDAFCMITWGGFSALKALSSTTISPFSKERCGTQLGEGSGILILESVQSAKKRGAKIYGIIEGWGASADAYHTTAPNPTGKTEANAMKRALETAQLQPEMIDVVGAHGTGTVLNDKMECSAIKSIFDVYNTKPLVTSIKSMIGHTMGAAGIHLAIATLGMINEGIVYPTINYYERDTECDVSVVANVAKRKSVNNVLINAFGFGGNNASVIIGKDNY